MRKLVLLSVPMLFGLVACGGGTSSNTAAPVVVNQVPAAGAKNVYLADEISVTFSKPMAASSVNATTAQFKIGSAVTPSTATLDASGTKVVLKPTALPALLGTVSVSLTGLTDQAGNVLAPFTSSFVAPDWQQMGATSLDFNPREGAFSPSMAFDSSGKPTVAWSETGGIPLSFGIYVKRWDGTAWQQLGATFLKARNNESTGKPSMALDSSGKPVVAWTESYNSVSSSYLYVKRWDGTAWQQLGTTYLNATNTRGVGFVPSIAFDSSGAPVVAWDEGDAIYVKRWDGTAWQQVGANANTGTSKPDYPSMALDSSGKPVVAWRGFDGISHNIYVTRWDGTAWQQVGTILDVNTNNDGFEPSIALDSGGKPTVAWREYAKPDLDRIYVKRWDGTAWQQVGATSLNVDASQRAVEPSIALDSSGKPVVAWSEYGRAVDYNIYVKRWDGTAWQQVGGTSLDVDTDRFVSEPSIALDSRGKPAVAWSEAGDLTGRSIYVKRLNRIP